MIAGEKNRHRTPPYPRKVSVFGLFDSGLLAWLHPTLFAFPPKKAVA